jgi:ornithine cyclodeaminase/alanine dehydrogenase-like protein (mu-crystallin family)
MDYDWVALIIVFISSDRSWYRTLTELHDWLMSVVDESDIVVTSGPIMMLPNSTIEKRWLHPGLFASSVDFGSTWMQDCLQQFDKMSTDDLAQNQYYRSIGYLDDFPEPYADLGQLISGTCQGRTDPRDRTITVDLGLALSDLSIAPTIYNKAVSHGLGTLLSL